MIRCRSSGASAESRASPQTSLETPRRFEPIHYGEFGHLLDPRRGARSGARRVALADGRGLRALRGPKRHRTRGRDRRSARLRGGQVVSPAALRGADGGLLHSPGRSFTGEPRRRGRDRAGQDPGRGACGESGALGGASAGEEGGGSDALGPGARPARAVDGDTGRGGPGARSRWRGRRGARAQRS